MTNHDTISALAPAPEPLEPEWSATTLAGILAETPGSAPAEAPWWRRTRRRAVVFVVGGVVAATAGTAVAMGSPSDVVRGVIEDFSQQPNTTGNGLGQLDDPQLIAQFETRHGLFAFWLATSSTDKVCYAYADGTWDGEGVPLQSELDYGCGGDVLGDDGQSVEQLTRPEQLGGFFKETAGPMVYGVSPYAGAVRVRVQGLGVDRILPVRADSHGFGAAIPEASEADAVTLTFLDQDGRELGTRRWVALVG